MNLQGWRYHVVGGDRSLEHMMEDACASREGLRDADIIMFSGGTDIAPFLYNEMGYHARTQASDKERDRIEQAVFHAAVAKKKFIVGICRGAQLVNVLNGGKLWQHVDNHNSDHRLIYTDETKGKHDVGVTSDHHQMMKVSDQGVVWGWAGTSKFKSTAFDDVPMRDEHLDDPEIVVYRSTRSLCFQPHPEWGMRSCRELFYTCVKRLMIGA